MSIKRNRGQGRGEIKIKYIIDWQQKFIFYLDIQAVIDLGVEPGQSRDVCMAACTRVRTGGGNGGGGKRPEKEPTEDDDDGDEVDEGVGEVGAGGVEGLFLGRVRVRVVHRQLVHVHPRIPARPTRHRRRHRR